MLSGSSSLNYQPEVELMNAGKKLLQCSTTEYQPDLIRILLQKLNTILCTVEQRPSKSMEHALQPVIKALGAKELVRHPNLDVNISLSCGFCEILRIFTPNSPYNHQQLKAFFEMVVVTFERLTSSSSGLYYKMGRVLEIFSRNNVFILMLDPQLDGAGLIVRLFKQFLTIVGSNPDAFVLEKMEKIMRIIIYESVDLKLELVDRLLKVLKDTNKIASDDCDQSGEMVRMKLAARLMLHFPLNPNIKTEYLETGNHCQQFLADPPKSVTEVKGKRKRDNNPLEKQVTSSVDDGKVCVQGYVVKRSLAQILEAVFKKHGDIAANCKIKTTSMRSSMLEVVCEVVKQIQSNSVLETMEETERRLSDAEAINVDVAWLRVHLEALERLNLVKQTIKNILLTERVAQTAFEMADAKVVAAKKQVEETEMFVNRLCAVEKNRDDKISECKARLDSLAQQVFP